MTNKRAVRQWPMGSNLSGMQLSTPQSRQEWDEYPYARVKSSGLRRVKHAADETGQWWSEFESDAGDKYRAESDSLGHRVGHFTDDAGKKFSGFVDEAGNRVKQFQDESGNVLDNAMGWASHSWSDARHAVGQQLQGVASAASKAGSTLRSGTRDLGGTVQAQTDQISRQVVDLFDKQPLIAGALAFAAGAALGAALPHTEQEDQLVGKQADKVRSKAGEAAGDLYEQGKDKAAEVYEEASAKAGDLYAETRGRIADTAQSLAKH